jgi:hypothetical protein
LVYIGSTVNLKKRLNSYRFRISFGRIVTHWGRFDKDTKIEVKLPLGESVSLLVEPGTVHGTILQLQGRGLYEFSMGSKGDFLVEIHIKVPKPRNQNDIEMLEEIKKKEIFTL